MPVYGFHCKSCGQPFQALVRGNSAPSCPVCASVDLELEVSLSADPFDPRDSKPLKGRNEQRSARVGGLRILFAVIGPDIVVADIGPRGEVYKHGH